MDVTKLTITITATDWPNLTGGMDEKELTMEFLGRELLRSVERFSELHDVAMVAEARYQP